MNSASRPAPDPARPGRSPALPLAVRRHALPAAVGRTLRERCGLEGPGPVLVAASGGADSTALLVACAVLRDHRHGDGAGLDPRAMHVHHHLRGADADADLRCVESHCARLGVPLDVAHIRPDADAGNLAARARAARYDALHDAARRLGASAILTAHHADDQLETVLMALARGSGLDGLAGMRWRRPLDARTALLRPLLDVRRAECVVLCRAAGLDWRDDPTNADPATVRGRLRRDVLPVLEALWPGAASRAAGAADDLAALRALVHERVEVVFGPASNRTWPREALAALPRPILTAGLRRAALDGAPACADDLPRSVLDAAARAIADDDRAPRRFAWPGGLALVVTSRTVRLEPASARSGRGDRAG